MSATAASDRHAGAGSDALTIGLIGAGRIGRVHAANVCRMRGATLAAVHDPLAAAATAICGEYGARQATIAEIMDDADIQAIMICAPTELHAELVERAAAAGKYIFCEKPIALETDRAAACLAVVERQGAFLMVGFNRRFDPHFTELRARIDAGAIGELQLLQITSRDPEPPPAAYLAGCGGLFRDMMIHDFDMARFLLGEEVVQVSASGSALIGSASGAPGEVDTAVATLQTASGKLCVITNSRQASYGYDQRIEAHGSLGMVEAGNPRQTTVRRADAGGFVAEPLPDFFVQRYAGAYRIEAEAFVASVRTGRAPRPDGRDGLRALQLAVAARKSLRDGRAVAVE